MKDQRVGMVSSYPSLGQSDWLWQQTPHAFGVWGNIQMLAQDAQPDFLLLYQFDFPQRQLVQPGQRQPAQLRSWLPKLRPQKSSETLDLQSHLQSLFRGVPKSKIVYLIREPPLTEVLSKTQANYTIAQQYCGYVSGPDQFAPQPDYMPAIWYHANSFRELNEMPPPEKSEPCSWITSGISRTENHRRRLAFLKSVQENLVIQKCLKIDFFGRNLPDWVASMGEVKNKWHSMAPYYYNLAIENYADNDWYVSEKLWDALLAWCLPIYYGGSAADRLLPPGSFLRLPSLDEKGVAYIEDVIQNPDLWHQHKPAIAEARQVILHRLNLLNWLSEFVGSCP